MAVVMASRNNSQSSIFYDTARKQGRYTIVVRTIPHPSPTFHSMVPIVCLLPAYLANSLIGYRLETGTAAELRLALTITLTLTDTGFAVLTLLLGYTRRSPDPPRTQEALS